MPKIRCSSAAAPQARWCDEKDAAYDHRGNCTGLQDITPRFEDPLIHFACHKREVVSTRCNPLHPGDCTITFFLEWFILHEIEHDDKSFDFQRCTCGQLTDMASKCRRSSSRARVAFKDTFTEDQSYSLRNQRAGNETRKRCRSRAEEANKRQTYHRRWRFILQTAIGAPTHFNNATQYLCISYEQAMNSIEMDRT